jgi:hypothetical protein
LNRTPPTLARLVGGAARGASRRPKLTIFRWLALVAGCLVADGLSGTRQLSNAASGMITAHTRARTASAARRPETPRTPAAERRRGRAAGHQSRRPDDPRGRQSPWRPR